MASATEGSFWMPPAASTVADDVDALFNFIMIINYVFFAVIAVGTIWFAWKYRRRSDDQLATSQIKHNTAIEAIWVFGPLALCFVVFIWGFKLYLNMSVAPADAYEVQVSAQKWQWSFTQANGETVPAVLHAPANRPVKLIMSSKDVVHSFFVPDFRVKADVVPGRFSTVWFEAKQPGDYQVFCAEYCGKDHSRMLATVRVLPQEEFDKKLKDGFVTMDKKIAPAEYGKKFYKDYACASCHSLDGTAGVGPSFKGLWGRTEKLEGGATVKVDEEYLRESIWDPKAKIVAGFAPVMPTFKGQINDDKMFAIIAYIKTLK